MENLFTRFLGADERGPCSSNLDCEYLFQCVRETCLHDDIFNSDWIQTLGYILIVIIIGISTAGGLGGGIEKVPVLMVLLNYSQKVATHFSYPLMFGANFCNFFMLIPQRHPYLNKPIIDYDIALILLPTSLFGSAMGAMLNKMLPDIMLMIAFIILMMVLVPGLILKGIQQRSVENKKSLVQSLMECLKDSELNYEIDSESKDQAFTDQQTSDRIYYEEQDNQLIPFKRFLLILTMFFFIEFIILMRGGDQHVSFAGISYCSSWYWGVTGMITSLLIVMTITNKWIVHREQKLKIDCLYLKGKNELIYDWNNYLKIWGAGMAGGVLGGMLGVGSGSVMVPILILLNVNSRVAAATSGFSKLFISAATVMLGFIQGDLDIQEIFFFMGLAMIGGVLITTLIYYLVNKYKQQSIIIFIVAGFLVLNVFSAIMYIIKESVFFDRWKLLTYSYAYC